MGLMNPKYPNLELIEYKFTQMLGKDEEWKKKVDELIKKNRYLRPDFSVTVFSQMWGSTCTAFDVMPDGSPAMGGDAMTRAYTTVIEETLTKTFGIFIGDTPCYMVSNAPDEFYADLVEKNMASLSVAKKRY